MHIDNFPKKKNSIISQFFIFTRYKQKSINQQFTHFHTNHKKQINAKRMMKHSLFQE